MAGTTGLEPATSAVTGQRSDQLSYVPRLPLAGNLDINVTEISDFAVEQAGWISPANLIRPSNLNKHWHCPLVYQKQKLAAHLRDISNP
jgi:hypothetical protein